MDELTAVVIGASGLTGSLVLQELLKDHTFRTVRVLVRRDIDLVHPKLHQEIVNFNDMVAYDQKLGEGDIIFCCIGTTLKKVKGDKTAYTEIDFDIPVNAARIGLAKGYKKFLIVSAIGAREGSSNFYLDLKGKTENALRQFPYKSLSIFRPSLLNGSRKENRMSEKLAQIIMDLLSFLLLGPLEKYRAVGADNVARAMVRASKLPNKGVDFYTYAEIMDLAHAQ
jgi:uncharacterized protein YbjT (DUF2867 family)